METAPEFLDACTHLNVRVDPSVARIAWVSAWNATVGILCCPSNLQRTCQSGSLFVILSSSPLSLQHWLKTSWILDLGTKTTTSTVTTNDHNHNNST